MKENCAECRHHDAFWGGSGCNLLNNGESCKFNPHQKRSKGVRIDPVQPPMTNADRIRAMNDEELALWICGVYHIEEEHGKFINGIIIPGYAPHDIEEWLQQPVEEDDHA